MLTRNSLRRNLSSLKQSAVTNIETYPIPSFFFGMFLGMLLVALSGYIYPLAVCLAVGFAGLWLFAEEEGGVSSAEGGNQTTAAAGSTSGRRAPDQAS